MQHVVTVDLQKNLKQYTYFLEVVKACNGITQKRKFAYGGAIRGGKTFITLFILVYLCNRYPGSKWAVIRDSFPSLQKTTIESLKKILHYSPRWRWNLDRGNYFVENEKGSRIYFMAENLAQDPDCHAFLGLEVNGIFFEQLEELSKKVFEIGTSRVGSWYLPDMPPAFVFTTFNPTQRWPKADLYEKAMAGTLPTDWHYQTALPTDNAFVTEDQWNTWGQMADRYQKQFIGGDWTDFDDTDPRWLFAFDEAKNVSKQPLTLIPDFPVNLSFDFNINPMTCIAGQHSTTFCRIMREFNLPNSNAVEMCMHVAAAYPHSVLTVTGDASGSNRNAGYTSGEETIWTQVKAALKLAPGQFLTPLSNPSIRNSRFLNNALMQHYPSYLIDPSCKQLIHECKTAKPPPAKKITEKNEDTFVKGAGNSEIGFNLLDCFRYYNHTHFPQFVIQPI